MLNGLAQYIFGSRNEDDIITKDKEEVQPQVLPSPAPKESEICDEEWILVDEDKPQDDRSSQTSEPTLLFEDDLGIMEASTIQSLLGASPAERRPATRARTAAAPNAGVIQRAITGDRDAVAQILEAPMESPALTRSQQAAEIYYKQKDMADAKLRRGNATHDATKSGGKSKQRKTRQKNNNSGRNNDRKCQYY